VATNRREIPMDRKRLVWLAMALLVMASAQAEDRKDSTKVEGVFVIPRDVASFEGRLVEVRLYEYDPLLADAAANLVEKVEFKDFSHTTGKETKKAFVIGDKGTINPKRSYYVTFFVLEGDKRTHIGKCEHDKEGIGKVLTGGQPSKITIEVREIKR
jgi:hypothetical protein